jgi:ribose transport system substrate-binding protein
MKKFSTLLSLITQDNDYQMEQAAVAKESAERLDIDLTIVYADSDGVKQSLQLLQSIQASADLRPQAIVVQPAGTAMPQVAAAAVKAGIGWVMLNENTDYIDKLRSQYPAPIFSVGTDNEAVGRIQGQQFNVLLPAGPSCVLYIEGPSTSASAQKRKLGMLATKRPDSEVRTLRADWTETGAYKAICAWLRLSISKELAVGLVGCQNDAMALGVRKAFGEIVDPGERDRFLTLPFTGCDGLPGIGQACVRRGVLAATVVTPPLAGIALEMLIQARRSKIQPAEQTLVAPRSYPPLEELRAYHAKTS